MADWVRNNDNYIAVGGRLREHKESLITANDQIIILSPWIPVLYTINNIDKKITSILLLIS